MPVKGIVLTLDNVEAWPAFKQMLEDGRVVADRTGRLRYPHGAPVGELVLVGEFPDGRPRYRESAKEWFDPGSQRAQEFEWP